MEPVLELLKLASVGLIAGLFSSYLANRDYRQRKWWKLRVAAYQNAIEALSDLVYYYENHYTAEIESRELSKEVQAQLHKYWADAFPKIRKFADSGAFLFSAEANTALREFIKDEPADSFFEHVDSRLARSMKCLERLVECSKVDLKLKVSWLERFL
ncbi:MAG: hypothetical protein WBQ69_01790 [Gallionella sp.]